MANEIVMIKSASIAQILADERKRGFKIPLMS